MNLSIEKIDKKGALSVETIELAFRRCTGAVEDKFYKAISQLNGADKLTKALSAASKYIDKDAEMNEEAISRANMMALLHGDITAEDLQTISGQYINIEEKKAIRRTKIQALQAIALVDTKHMKDFESDPDSDFWQSVSADEIESAIAFFRKRNGV